MADPAEFILLTRQGFLHLGQFNSFSISNEEGKFAHFRVNSNNSSRNMASCVYQVGHGLDVVNCWRHLNYYKKFLIKFLVQHNPQHDG